MTVFKQLLNDYKQCLLRGDHSDGAAAYLAIVAEHEKAARRDPAAPVPHQDEQSVFEDWLGRVNPSGDVTEVQRQWEASSDYLDWLAAAPQPPEADNPWPHETQPDGSVIPVDPSELAAPVQISEPWGVAVGDRILVGRTPAHVPKIAEHEGLPLCKLYTEQQVRQLLDEHGIKANK